MTKTNQLREQLQFIYEGAAVKRFHTESVIREQTDGAHSFGVAWFCYLLTDGHPTVRLLLAALSHDLAERVTGDVPGPTKRVGHIGAQLAGLEAIHLGKAGFSFGEFLSSEDVKILNLADRLDGMMYCIAERRLGNLNARDWYRNFWNYCHELGFAHPLGKVVDDLWEEANRG